MNILWHTLAVGPKISCHLEAQLLILSLFAHRAPGDRIRIGTDQPHFYRWLQPIALEIEEIPPSRVQQWIDERPAGTNPYFYRAKLARCAELESSFQQVFCRDSGSGR